MAFFSNKRSDEELEAITRVGGEALAQGMASTYGMIGLLERGEIGLAIEARTAAIEAILLGIGTFGSAIENSHSRPLTLAVEEVGDIASVEEVLAWLERRGIPLDNVTDSELLRIVVDGLHNYRDSLGRFELGHRQPSFESANALVRAAIDLQLLALGITAMFELSARAEGSE